MKRYSFNTLSSNTGPFGKERPQVAQTLYYIGKIKNAVTLYCEMAYVASSFAA